MTTMNISLPVVMRKFIETQVAEEGYGTVSEYVRKLVREEQKRKTKEKLETLILEGLNSGEPIEVTPEYWEELRRRLKERGAKRKKRA
jgi:antitoxin ParD1/3/4